MLPKTIELGEPDFLEPLDMFPHDDNSEMILVHITDIVQGEPNFIESEPDYIEDDLCFPEPDFTMINVTITTIEEGKVEF